MKSERDVFHEMKTPLPQVIYKNNNRPVPPRDNFAPALKALSDRQTAYEVPSNPITDEYGNPLIGSATNEQVLSLRKNREQIFATRNFLDKAMTRKAELPGWAQPTPIVTKPLNREEEEKYALKNVLNKKNQGGKDSLSPRNQGVNSLPNLTTQGSSLSRGKRPGNTNAVPDFLESPDGVGLPEEEKRYVENLLKKKPQDPPAGDGDYDSLPDFLR